MYKYMMDLILNIKYSEVEKMNGSIPPILKVSAVAKPIKVYDQQIFKEVTELVVTSNDRTELTLAETAIVDFCLRNEIDIIASNISNK